MHKSDYEKYVESRCKPYVDKNYCAVALAEESGEVCGYWKKYQLRGNPDGKFTPDDLKSELGDVLFYLTRMALLHGWSLDDVMQYNVEKLDQRVAKGKVVG